MWFFYFQFEVGFGSDFKMSYFLSRQVDIYHWRRCAFSGVTRSDSNEQMMTRASCFVLVIVLL